MSRRRTASSVAPVPTIRRCAVYTRKSTTQNLDMEFSSLDAQREACLSYIERQPGWQLIPTRYDDGGWSGASLERPAFQRLMEDVETGNIDVVVVYKLDRLSRSLRDFARLMDTFESRNVAFVSVTQSFDSSTSMGKLTINLLMSFAEFEREMISERTRDKVAASRRRGKWTGGPVPLGYRSEDRKLVVEESEAPIIRELFQSFLRLGDATLVAREMENSGLQPRPHALRKRKNGPSWTKANVTRILKSPIYAGLILCGDERVPGQHEALIDMETWERVQALMVRSERRDMTYSRNPEFLLRGILHCAMCGGAYTSTSVRRPKREYRYYCCTSRNLHGPDACPARGLPADGIESFVFEQIRAATTGGNLVADVLQRLNTRIPHQRQVLMAERRGLPTQIARLSAEAANLAASLGNLRGSARRTIEQRIDAVCDDLNRREERLAAVEKSLVVLDEAEIEGRWVAGVLQNFSAVWDVMTVQNRARLVRALVQRVDVNEPACTVKITLVDISLGDSELDGLRTEEFGDVARVGDEYVDAAMTAEILRKEDIGHGSQER